MKHSAWTSQSATIGGGEFSPQELGAFVAGVENLAAALRFAVARIELANIEGDKILSAWLPEAKAALKAMEVPIVKERAEDGHENA